MHIPASTRRIVIAGVPKSGKTTDLGRRLAEEMSCPLRSTDSLIDLLNWADASMEVSRWLSEPAPWIIEGAAVPRAIRKWFRRTQYAPCDAAIWLATPHVPLSQGQRSMASGCLKVWDEILPALMASGVHVIQQ